MLYLPVSRNLVELACDVESAEDHLLSNASSLIFCRRMCSINPTSLISFCIIRSSFQYSTNALKNAIIFMRAQYNDLIVCSTTSYCVPFGFCHNSSHTTLPRNISAGVGGMDFARVVVCEVVRSVCGVLWCAACFTV